uniref:Uncharacterized protein n=1 Tax=Solanum tuberosum TaxID=4113 RepID=M1DSH0_SOLTU
MDDSTPSKRIARGTSLHVKVFNNQPSFSLGLTQDFGVNAGSMEKSKQILQEKSIEELRSKKKNDPIALPEVINNVKASDIKVVEGGSTRKAKDSDSEEVVSPSLDQEHQIFA